MDFVQISKKKGSHMAPRTSYLPHCGTQKYTTTTKNFSTLLFPRSSSSYQLRFTESQAHDEQNLSIKEKQERLNFHNRADRTLSGFQESLEIALEDEYKGEFDISYSDGILNIQLEQGTYCLNKQTPNKQIWFSSPIR